jgi:SAM-dependent methyltransferase
MTFERSCAVCEGRRFGTTLGRLSRCQTCSHTQFFYDPASAANLYADAYFNGGEYAAYLSQERALRRSMRRHLEQMAHYGPLRGSLLEVGCAYGLFLDEARQHFDAVAGVDICAGPLAYAKEHFGLDVVCADFARMDLASESYDVVCMWDTIEHLPNPSDFVSAAHEVLRPRGLLYLTTGDVGALNARLRGKRWRQIHPPTHLQYFSRATMTQLLESSSFSVLGVETASYYHTLYNVLAMLSLRGGAVGTAARLGLGLVGDAMSARIGSWINLGDIMFVAAQRC